MARRPGKGDFTKTITVGMTGASGAIYGLSLLRHLVEANCKIYLLLSDAAKVVLETEADMKLPGKPEQVTAFFRSHLKAREGQLVYFPKDDWFSPVASGSGAPRQMVVCPCTAGTLSAVAAGASDNLLERAADVVLKEQGRLILVLRETPLSAIHLENMLKLSRLGVVIMPASPSFYNRPETVDALVDSVVLRVLDQLEIDHRLSPRWGREP